MIMKTVLKIPSSSPKPGLLREIGELPIEQKLEEKQLTHPQNLLTSEKIQSWP